MTYYICATCLSSGRLLRPADGLARVYNTLLLGLHKMEASCQMFDSTMICWECHSAIKKILLFHQKVQKALRQFNEDANPVFSYSSLVTVLTTELNYEFIEDNSEIKKEIKPENYDTTLVKHEFLNDISLSENAESENCDEIQEIDQENAVTNENYEHRKCKPKVKLQNFAIRKGRTNFRRKTMNENEMWDWRSELTRQEPYFSAKHKCTTCIKVFNRQYILDKHMTENHTMELGYHICSICKRNFTSEELLRKHKHTHYHLYSCTECAFVCAEQIYLIKSHVLTNHSIGGKHNCERCCEIFETALQLKNHVKKHYRQKMCTCDYCGKNMNKSHLIKHIRIHTGQPAMTCEFCGKVCRGEFNLRYHMRTKHAPPATDDSRSDHLYCVECDRHFKSAAYFQYHLKATKIHGQQDLKYACLSCPQRFISEKAARYHEKRNHIEKNCDICGIVLKSLYGLQKHVRSVHKPKPVECNVCNRTIKNKRRMAEHMRTHTGERPHQCAECGDRFRQRASLYMHRRLKHKETRKKDE